MWILSPLSWLLLALLLGTWAWRRRLAWLRRMSVVVAVVAVLATTPMVANEAVAWLESPQPAPFACASDVPAVAILLAGGIDALPRDRDDYSVLNDASRRRVERAVAWWRERPGRRLVVSGGTDSGGIPPADLMAAYARRLGVPGTAIGIERRSTSSCENGQALARMQPPLPHRVVLVTSAMHMRRARYAVESAGFDACPVPADTQRIPFGLPGSLIPRTTALAKSEAAVHELVGLLHYRWRCRPSIEPQLSANK